MGCAKIIDQLKCTGTPFAPGLTAEELTRTETTFGFRFPKEIRDFLTCGCPCGGKFFDFRDCSEENKRKFDRFQEKIEASFRFDLEHNAPRLKKLLGAPFFEIADDEALRDAVLLHWKQSPRLIPFYGHRCFFDGMDGMPIVSFCQPVDTVFYGSDFENYLMREFLEKECPLGAISEAMKDTGIWASLVCP